MDGILGIWKPAGMTSHDVVFRARKLLGIKKIGHTGTLDPDVEGVLVLCLGKATKLVEFLMDGQKVYRGSVTLGFATETEDRSGAIIAQERVSPPIAEATIDRAMAGMVGTLTQIPPYYSAVKVKGRPLYTYARQGRAVDRPQREVKVMAFHRLGPSRYDGQAGTQTWDFEVTCSKGTYVRTLAVDLGRTLGYPAHMSHLVRLATGGISREETHTLEELAALAGTSAIETLLLPIEVLLSHFPQIALSDSQYLDHVRYGKVLPKDYFGQAIETLVAFTYQGKWVALYYPHPEKVAYIKPRKMFI